jgi:2,4-dienoyl-CoA reductase-like NADH-dependent reductase (Old Yellow Enzyme family)
VRRDHPQVKTLKRADALRAHLDALGVTLPFADPPDLGALRAPIEVAGRTCPNRFAILPMEGWDGSEQGRPTELVRRRWERFGQSGAGLVWGGEAFAVRPEGRANPHQLCLGPSSAADLAELHRLLDPGQVTGLQLTHSGRWSVEPRPARAEPLLDARRTGAVLSQAELDAIADDYVTAARLARDAGFDFVDVKACHGYLLHELLSGSGALEERARTMRTIIERVRAEGIRVGVRLSTFDLPPHRPGPDGVGEAEAAAPWGFADPLGLVDHLGIDLLCVTAGSPYYCPHAQRPAWFPPSDGYSPPEDPLVGVARLLDSAAAIAAARPAVTVVATGFSYLQEWLPHVASAMVRDGGAAFAGIGRMALSYPDLPADVLAGRPLDGRRLCRTFSDCTTAPRNGLVSGCFPLDPFYKEHPDRKLLVAAKRGSRA